MQLSKLLFRAVQVLLCLALVGCSSSTSTQPPVARASEKTAVPAYKTIVAVDGQSQISVPNSWQELDDLNDQADLQVGNDFGNIYAMVITEDKSNFASFDEYAELVYSGFIRRIKSPEVEGPVDLRINDCIALQYKILGTLGSMKITMFYILIKADKNYHQFIVWTPSVRFKSHESTFEHVIASFQDISK